MPMFLVAIVSGLFSAPTPVQAEIVRPPKFFKVTVRDRNFEVVRELIGLADLLSFETFWNYKKVSAFAGEVNWDYTLDVLPEYVSLNKNLSVKVKIFGDAGEFLENYGEAKWIVR